MAATQQRYKKPPITEAVIEFRFEQPASQARIEKVAQRLKRSYAFSDPEQATEVTFDTKEQKVQKIATEWRGIRLNSADRADITILRKTSFVCSRLAPYLGWEALQERAERDWRALRKVGGLPKISRLGTRYINRLDIPVLSNATLQLENYLNVSPNLPKIEWAPITNFNMQVIRSLGVDDCNLILNTGKVLPPPLLGHVSVALDIDISRVVNLPQRDTDLWALLETMRAHKNRIFEACITDRARELFDK